MAAQQTAATITAALKAFLCCVGNGTLCCKVTMQEQLLPAARLDNSISHHHCSDLVTLLSEVYSQRYVGISTVACMMQHGIAAEAFTGIHL